MQEVTTDFNVKALKHIRQISTRLLASFPKAFEEDVTFFSIGESIIGGIDIIKGVGDVITEWDKYQYDDYSLRVKSVEITRVQEFLNSVTLAQADVSLENHDNYFTPNRGSQIQDYILPYRPIKLFAGFSGEDIPLFVGLTEKMPKVDERSKNVSFHCIDFLYSLFNRPLDRAVIYENKTTDEILEGLFSLVGIDSSQYSFDSGFNTIGFAFFDKGSKLGNVVKELVEADLGRMFLDEQGLIVFKNRQNYDATIKWFFNESNIIDIETSQQDDIINVVEVKANVREVQANQKFWETQEAVLVKANSSVNVWADFDDPVTGCDDPQYITAATTSLFATNTLEDGSGSAVATGFSLTSSVLFSKSFLMEFTNDNGYDVYITAMELFATPAKVVKQIYVREQDDASVAAYDERVRTIENNFITTESDATSIAKIVLGSAKDLSSEYVLNVVGNPALQVGDLVNVSVFGSANDYLIRKIVNRWEEGGFSQRLTVRLYDYGVYFTVGESVIGGLDEIAP